MLWLCCVVLFVGHVAGACQAFMVERCVDWVASEAPLNTAMPRAHDGIRCVSAGHKRHEYTSGVAIEAIFEFLCSTVARAATRE